MKKAAGFSVIEVVITLAVGAIALTIAIPSYTNLVKGNRLTSHANMFVTAMTLARTEALRRQTIVTVEQLSGSWDNGWTVTSADETFVRKFPAQGTSVTFTSAGGAESFIYLANGRLSGAGDTIELCDDRTGEKGREITVSATGRLSVEHIDCD